MTLKSSLNLNSTKNIDFKCFRNMKKLSNIIALKIYTLVREKDFPKREKIRFTDSEQKFNEV